MNSTFRFLVNGKSIKVTAPGDRPLLWVLRTDLGLTGTKYGCGEGLCGACTVLIDNMAMRSCRVPVSEAAGKTIVTIEGLEQSGELHPLQQAFIDHDAVQCGFCTPGMIMNASSLLRSNPAPSREQVITAMDDNLCRCGSHQRVIDAIQAAGQMMTAGGTK